MNKNEYLSQLKNELKKNCIPDSEEIMLEYEQHFDFKIADGFTEDEISARLGNPSLLAAQFKPDGTSSEKNSRRKISVYFWLPFTDIMVSIFFIMHWAWDLVIVAASISFAALAVCLFGGINPYSLIPPMPYWCGAVLGISSAAMSVLSAVGFFYFALLVRQIMRSYRRFHQNVLSSASGKAILPSLPTYPQIPRKSKRRMRNIAMFSFTIFLASFICGFIISAVSAGSFEFWHVWNWFV